MGNFRQVADTQKHTKVGQCDRYQYAVSHMCGWRLYMEDAHIASVPFGDKKLGLFAVFDGHGGPQCAIFVQRHFGKQLQNSQSFKEGKYQLALKQAFLKMDELLLTEAGKAEISKIKKQQAEKGNAYKNDDPSHAGCTANVVLITQDTVYCANSGDSRAVGLVAKKTVALSEDHKPEDPNEQARITKAGGTVELGRVNGNLNLSRALGDLQYKCNSKLPPQEQMITANPDIRKFPLKGFQYIIMGCDGIWEVKDNDQMTKWVSKKLVDKKPQVIVEELLDELVSKDRHSEYGMDNMSSILIVFKAK